MFSPFLTLNCSCDEAMQWSSKNLTQNGFRVMQTFDLHAARHALVDCPCPDHATSACDCQMVVLLVYGKTDGPVTLMLHGNNGQTQLSISDNPPQPSNTTLMNAIRQVLELKTSLTISQIE